MNDTIAMFTPRQKAILNLLNSSQGLAREELANQLVPIHPISKVTLLRDLKTLIKADAVTAQGKARAYKYFPKSQRPVLRDFDPKTYFLTDPDSRQGVKENFNYRVFDDLHDLFTPDELALILKGLKSFSRVQASYDTTSFKKELERFVIELAWKSSKIEGNTYTLLDTEALIKYGVAAVGKKREEAVMILNHKRAFDVILQNRYDFKSLTLPTVAELHNVLVAGLNVSTGIRKHAVGITGTRYKPLDNEHQLREALEKTLATIDKLTEPLEKALVISFMLPYIQPFADGNKRTARMLANAVLLAHDLYPLSYRSVAEDDFKKALIIFYEQQSVAPYKKIFVDQVTFANQTYFV